MTILFLSRLFYPHIGGVEKHVLEISKLLVKKGHLVTVLTEKFERGLLDTDETQGIKILRIDNGKDNWFKKFRVWKNIFKYRKLIKESDMVHVHDVFFWYLLFRFLYPSKKVFTTFHGYEGNKIPGFKSKLMHKISEKLSNGNICVGGFLRKWYGTKANYTTYGGVEIVETQNSKLKTQNYNSKLKILFIGRLEKDTGVPIYLKTLSILKQKGIDFEFEACGNGLLYFRVAQYGRVHGFVENLSLYMKNTDIVLASSYLSVLEALAAKKPVFSVYENPLKEDYLKMAPFAKFVSLEDNPQKLVDRIEHYLNHKNEIEEKVNKGFNWVKDQTWDKIVDVYLKLWKISL